MTTEAQPGTVIEAIVVTKDMLREAITQYIVESRTGGTLSYQTTAMMPADDVANSNAEHLWGLLSERTRQYDLPMLDAERSVAAENIKAGAKVMYDANRHYIACPADDPAPPEGFERVIAGEDIERGQIVTFNESGELIGYVEPPVVIGEDVNPAAESGFFDSV